MKGMTMQTTAQESLDKHNADKERWKMLTDRLAEELGNGYTLNRIVNEIGDPLTVSVDRLRAWTGSPLALRAESRYVGEHKIAEKLESKLAAWFAELDTERATAQTAAVPFVETAVSRKVWDGLEQARELCVPSEISAPPGTGKSCAVEQYLAKCRKLEGFGCPVWRISLKEGCISLNYILQLILREINPAFGNIDERRDYALFDLIAEKTEGRGGLLIVDEAQHIGDATKINGISVFNGLRSLIDDKYFGIAFMSNGEIYRRVAGGKYMQLASRMEAWRININGVPDEDVDTIMAAWNISGKPARKWCIDKAKGAGGLRALTNDFILARRKFGEVNYQTLTMLGRI